MLATFFTLPCLIEGDTLAFVPGWARDPMCCSVEMYRCMPLRGPVGPDQFVDVAELRFFPYSGRIIG